MKLHEKVWREMARHGLNQQKLARLAGVSDSEISRILAGKSNPSLEYARRIAEAIQVSLDFLANDDCVEDPTQSRAVADHHEQEILGLAHGLGLRESRTLLENAQMMGWEVANRRLLGIEGLPRIEIDPGRGTSPAENRKSILAGNGIPGRTNAQVG